ncbi:MBL fold metallo-hydrolase [Mycoplasma sp. P36-A1]|uniref:MBL fold metallo-hydrolase n=1 Tax=Mycoplasma sp. P36-A1 TaxID=3252900 RepID=UPI003C2F8934
MSKLINLVLSEQVFKFGLKVNVVAIVNDNDEFMLVDSGFVGSYDSLIEQLDNNKLLINNLKGIIVTHQDHDHIANLAYLKKLNPSIEIYSSKIEKPYLDGSKENLRIKPLYNRIDYTDPLKKIGIDEQISMISSIPTVEVDKVVEDNQVIDFANGLTIILTPGHMPGHLCVLVNELKTLIAGDMFTVEKKQLLLARRDFSLNYEDVIKSTKKLLNYNFDKIIAYHGGEYNQDVKQTIKELLKKEAKNNL